MHPNYMNILLSVISFLSVVFHFSVNDCVTETKKEQNKNICSFFLFLKNLLISSHYYNLSFSLSLVTHN